MVAYTKGAKLARKRGRPRLPATNTTREPNGQPSRRKERMDQVQFASEQEATSVVVARRIRHNKIAPLRLRGGKTITSEELAKDPRRGYALGLMLIDGAISKAQHDAGIRYGEDMARYYSLTGIPFPSVRAQNLFAVRGEAHDSEDRIKAAKAARNKAKALQALLLACGDINTGRRIEHCIKSVCVMDIPESRGWPAHMTSWLVRGLNALGRFYGI